MKREKIITKDEALEAMFARMMEYYFEMKHQHMLLEIALVISMICYGAVISFVLFALFGGRIV